MSRFRKLVTTAVVAAMAMGIMVPSSFAALPKDVVGTQYVEAVNVLNDFGIIVGDAGTGDFRPEDTIKRSEFAKIAVMALGLDDAAKSSQSASRFPDVPQGHWATGYINVAAEQGIVIGDDTGKFRPDDTITYAEAVTLLVRAVGHEPAAKSLGGYPTGYLVVGAQEKITKNAGGSANTAAKRGMVVQMLYNSLTVPMMEQTGFGTDVNYEVPENYDTLLSRMDITKYENVQVVGTKYANMNGFSSTNEKDEVRVYGNVDGKAGNEDESFTVLKIDPSQYLGNMADIYVNDEDEIISINPIANKNVELTIDGEDVVTLDSNNTKFEYEDKDEEIQDEKIAEDATFVQNGVTVDNWSMPASGKLPGTVTLLDSDDNGVYDIVFVTQYTNYIVDEVNASRDKVTFKDDSGFVQGVTLSSLELDPDDDNIDFSIIKDGKSIALSDLKEWDVLSVVSNSKGSKTLYTIYVNANSVQGKVVEQDSEEGTITINDKDYELAANIAADAIALEDEGTFYLDMNGKIAGFDTESQSNNYAVILQAAKSSGIDSAYDVKLINAKGEEVVYKTADKVKLNDSTMKAEDAINSLIGTVLDSDLSISDLTKGLITFELNSEGKINEIQLQSPETAYTAEERMFNKDDMTFVDAASNNAEFYVDDKTVVFDVSAKDADSKPDTTEFDVQGSNFFNDEENYTVAAFDVKDGIAKAIVVLEDKGGKAISSNIAVVDKFTQTKNDGDNVYKLYAIVDGKPVSMYTEDMLVKSNNKVDGTNYKNFSDLERGDLIAFKTNAKGDIEEFTLLSHYEIDDNSSAVYTNADTKSTMIEGTVQKKIGNRILVENNGYVTVGTDVPVYEYKLSNKTVSTTDISDISQEDQVFVHRYDGTVTQVVVIKTK